jgi:hypothetical protein
MVQRNVKYVNILGNIRQKGKQKRKAKLDFDKDKECQSEDSEPYNLNIKKGIRIRLLDLLYHRFSSITIYRFKINCIIRNN